MLLNVTGCWPSSFLRELEMTAVGFPKQSLLKYANVTLVTV